MPHARGTLFEHYEILSLLGKGGMGEVYLAYDTQRRREVALKLLPAEFAEDAERLRRFAQEAFAATTLESDYFVNIYEIGQARSFPFLAMEYVRGVTLRQRLRHARLTVGESLRVAAQVAEALAAAHESGIVHRDIKPENIMLRGDDRIKVLDLGLAKLTEVFHRRISTPDAVTVTNFSTGQGAIIGTVNYMSPEQLRGLVVDERTDLWSLGVVLYEMLSGQSPFRGHAPGEVIVSILEREPPSLSQFWPEMPAELERVLGRLLEKERESRYHFASEVLSEVGELGRAMEAEVAGHVITIPAPQTTVGGITNDSRVGETASAAGDLDTLPESDARGIKFDESAEAGRPAGGALIMRRADDLRRHRLNALILSLLVLAAGGTGYLGYRAYVGARSAAAASKLRFTRLEMPSDAREAALSPDGKHVVAILETVAGQSLVVRELSSPGLTEVVAPNEGQFMGLTFSPDGQHIYYLRKGQETGTLFRVPTRGGAQQKLLENVNTPVTFSPGGDRLAFVRYDTREQSSVLMTARADGTDERSVAVRYPPASFTLGGFRVSGPAWSPDGRVIACPTSDMSRQLGADVVAVNLDDGTQRRINAVSWASIERIAWSADGSGLVMNAADTTEARHQIWLLSYASGEARRITNDPNSYQTVSVSRAFDSLVTVKSYQLSNIWLSSAADASAPRPLANSKHKGANGILWTHDGRLVYTSNESDVQSIWRMAADGSGPRQLTASLDPSIQPATSANGRYMVFVSYREGVPHIWRADGDGSNAKQLTNGLYEDTPQITPDGRWVVYHSIYPERDSIWRVPIDGGEPQLLSKVISLHPVVSPDGTLIASFSRDADPAAPWRIALMPSDGGEPVGWLDLAAAVDVRWPVLRWSPDGRALTYVATAEGVSNVWRQALDGGPPMKLTDFTENQIFSFAWSADGKQLACVRGLETSDVVIIGGFE